jgi:hypothetical protein
MTTVKPINSIEPDNLPLQVLHQQAQIKVQRVFITLLIGFACALAVYAITSSASLMITEDYSELANDIRNCHQMDKGGDFVYGWTTNGCEALRR